MPIKTTTKRQQQQKIYIFSPMANQLITMFHFMHLFLLDLPGSGLGAQLLLVANIYDKKYWQGMLLRETSGTA